MSRRRIGKGGGSTPLEGPFSGTFGRLFLIVGRELILWLPAAATKARNRGCKRYRGWRDGNWLLNRRLGDGLGPGCCPLPRGLSLGGCLPPNSLSARRPAPQSSNPPCWFLPACRLPRDFSGRRLFPASLGDLLPLCSFLRQTATSFPQVARITETTVHRTDGIINKLFKKLQSERQILGKRLDLCGSSASIPIPPGLTDP